MMSRPRSPSDSIVASARSPCTSRSFARPRSYRSSSGMARTSPSLSWDNGGRYPVGPGPAGILGPVDEPTIADETEALGASPRTGDHARDQRVILGNTGQNVLGLVIGALATFAA